MSLLAPFFAAGYPMVRCRIISLGQILIATLLLAGCASLFSTHDDRPVDFVAAPDEAKVFIYADYAEASDKPWIGEIFRVYIDTGYQGDIDDRGFVTARLLPGDSVVDVDQLNWDGNGVSHSTLKLHLQPGETSFIKEHISADEKTGTKAELLRVPESVGQENIRMRKRFCACG
jgi:hypothetical protein